MRHGRTYTYSVMRCRCTLCRKAHKLYTRQLRADKILKGICVECSQPARAGRKKCDRHLRLANERLKRHHDALTLGPVIAASSKQPVLPTS